MKRDDRLMFGFPSKHDRDAEAPMSLARTARCDNCPIKNMQELADTYDQREGEPSSSGEASAILRS